MADLIYKNEVFQLVGFCMEIHRELGQGHDELISKLRLGLLVNFGGDSLEWKRVVL